MAVQIRDGVLWVEGPVELGNARSLVAEGRRLLDAGTRGVDLSGVTRSDSAGLAVLLDWMRSARAQGHVLAVRGLPSSLQVLARVYGVESLVAEGGAAA